MFKHEPKDDDIRLSVLENGLDFIRSGLKHIGSSVSKFGLKYGSKSFFDSIGDKAINDTFDLTFNVIAKKA